MSDPSSVHLGSIRRVMIVGCGRLGSAFAEAFAGHGIDVIPVSARRRFSAGKLARALGLESSFRSIDDAWAAASPDLIVLTVPDDAIATVAVEVQGARLLHPGVLVAHPSGSHGSDILSCCRGDGAITASLHPLQTFPRGLGDGSRFEGITFAFEGETGALAPLRELAFRLGADAFEVPADRKAEYHTAAVLACNCLVALMTVALRLFGHVGSLPGESMKRLRPLIDATLDNMADLGPVGALTGPVARGDVSTISMQIDVVRRHLPDQLALYQELSRSLVEIAWEMPEANREGLEAILTLLEGIADRSTGHPNEPK